MPDPSEMIAEKIGITPFTGAKPAPTQREQVITWLVLQGIPKRSAELAQFDTMATAYSSRPYLRGWQQRVGGKSKVNLAGINLGEDAPQGASVVPPKPAPTPRAEITPVVFEKDDDDDFDTPPASRNGLSDTAIRHLIQTLTDSRHRDFRNEMWNKFDDLGKDLQALLVSEIERLASRQRIEVRLNGDDAKVHDLGVQHEKFPILLRSCTARDHKGYCLNVWLTGPTGSGKTSSAEFVARALDLPFGADSSLDADYKVLGFRDANGHIISTEFLRIFTGGGIYVADEIDNWNPSALLSLNSALANGWASTPGGMVQRHKDCRIIACANTWGMGATNKFVGRTKLDAATLNRFMPKIEWNIDEKLEREVARTMAENSDRWVNVVQSARAKVTQAGMEVIVSPRDTFNGLALLNAGFNEQEVMEMTFLAGLRPEQRKQIVPTIAWSAAA